MLIKLNERLGVREEGFTLIELMVVVLIIAILIAIAIPTFLGARQRAQDRAAQSNVRNAFTAEKTFFTDGQSYTQTAGSLAATGNLIFLHATTVTTTNDTVVLGAQSGSGKCFWLKDNTATGTRYATSNAPCAEPASI